MKYFNVLAALLLFAIYSLGSIPPSDRFNLWLTTFLIPFALILNILLVFTGIAFRKKTTIFLLAALVFGGNYLTGTIGIKSLFSRSDPSVERSFSVLNYNLSGFNVLYQDDDVSPAPRDSLLSQMVRWVLNSPSGIQCFQEFLHDPDRNDIDVLKEIKDRGHDFYFSASTNKWNGSRFGTLIASRFPIVASGDVMASDNGFNRIAFADISVAHDTIRIINVHLQSMQMKGFHPGYSESIEDRSRDVRVVLRKLKSGVFERSRQVRQLIQFVRSSPHPVICAGDFNELPYSYSYQMLRKHLTNAFEESGSGFGFTYQGNTLSMLRIDNQFYSSPLRCVDFNTLDTIRFTDHFPLLGTYALP